MKTNIKEIIVEEKFHNTNFPETYYIVKYKSGICRTYYNMEEFPETVWNFYMTASREIMVYNHTYKILRFYRPTLYV